MVIVSEIPAWFPRHYLNQIFHCKDPIYIGTNRNNYSPLFLVFLFLMLSQKIFHKGIEHSCCHLTFIWVLFAEDCFGRCFTAALQQLSLRLGELRMFNWLNDILFSWTCKNFQKHLDGDLCIFFMLYISDLSWRTYTHRENQEMKKKVKVGRWVHALIHKSWYSTISVVWWMLHPKETLLVLLTCFWELIIHKP